ncbi:fructose-bisphosphate aldolase [Nitzschia inconspicua]|uniref:fructose-bisphosphate aldolase n=1 Tax=Nitzschia inconspicua TaxID=303405 RepID=A0A9K3PQY7_9STRA|nr:fructose-bisphosphate aldolase [Nitzschia inconspicua]KAG7353999.1 fructose-bisphosphate aldolase [Nitzschia inconspicua]
MKFSVAILLVSSAVSMTSAFVPAYTRTSPFALKGGMSEDVGLPCEDDCAIEKYPNLPERIHPGVLSGQAMMDLLEHAKQNGYAIPAVNCVSSSGINACLEAARANDAPIIIQFSSGGSQFYGGKGLDNSGYRAAIAGAVSGAFHVRTMAEQYGVPVILHTDHCSKQLLPWVDGLIAASERYFESHGEPLFSSHMIDLSEEPLEENLEICKDYLKRMDKIGLLLEMELGITGGEEDGVDNSDRPIEDLYSKPEEIYQTYEELSKVSNKFTVAAAFGNVHGVYKPGNVKLEPEILNNAQEYITEKLGDKAPADKKPVMFVFHGGSGSDVSDIQKSLGYGVIKMNIDTDTQWSYWEGIKNFEAKYHDYLQGQIGNPEGEDKPNKKYYDPRECMRAAEVNTVKRLETAFADLKCQNILGLGQAEEAKNVLGPRRGGLPV